MSGYGELDIEKFGANANASEVLNYTGDNLTSIVVTITQPELATRVFTQTLTYTATKLTAVSKWVES